jgi:hypothetical protein
MKTRRLFIICTLLVLILNISYTTYGVEVRPMSKYSRRVVNLLKDKLEISEIEIENARIQGKTAFDIAKSKGMEEAELRQCITVEATKAIDGLGKKGIMPILVVKIIKSLASMKIQAWDGRLD